MGCCCFKAKDEANASYRKEIGSELVKELLPKLNNNKNSRVIIFYLKSIKNIELHNPHDDNPYVEIKLKPSDSIAGDQLQRSSYKPATVHPQWEPNEKFQFIISDDNDTHIAVSVLSYKEKDPVPLGDAKIKIKDLALTKIRTNKSVKLIDSTTGKNNGVIQFDILFNTVNEALSYEEQTVFQYERYQPVVLWGSTYPGHFLPTDPGINLGHVYTGLYSSSNGLKYYKTLDEAGPPVPEGWKVNKQWYILSNEFDANGWEYAGDFTSTRWFPQEATGLFVRRRKWCREVGIIDNDERNSIRNSLTTNLNTRRGRKTTDDD